jgi:hypothetical protein
MVMDPHRLWQDVLLAQNLNLFGLTRYPFAI